jgi:hypothetical protein
MPWNYGFFIRILIRREKRDKAQGQVNKWIGRLNGKEIERYKEKGKALEIRDLIRA